MNKRNKVPPPTYPASSGEAVFDYTNHDGRALIGEGETAFETKWSKGGGSSIHVYNDPQGIRGVAIARDATSLEDITVASVAGLNFTSRSRQAQEGQIVVFENTSGRFLAAKVVDIRSTDHGDVEDRLALSYSVVPIEKKSAQVAEVVHLAQIAQETLRSLDPEALPIAPTRGGIGHNNPPSTFPLNVAEFRATVNALQDIQQEASRDVPDVDKLKQSKRTVSDVAKKIVKWVGHKCNLAADEFAKQLGKTLADGKFLAAAWLAMSGRLDQLMSALDRLF
ncbi:MAG: hypothetical protein KDJ29_09120 [Hyphomicrobiales bacterium]|nr:hypothetical protein [Hyphomicrobiales bacterium]